MTFSAVGTSWGFLGLGLRLFAITGGHRSGNQRRAHEMNLSHLLSVSLCVYEISLRTDRLTSRPLSIWYE